MSSKINIVITIFLVVVLFYVVKVIYDEYKEKDSLEPTKIPLAKTRKRNVKSKKLNNKKSNRKTTQNKY